MRTLLRRVRGILPLGIRSQLTLGYAIVFSFTLLFAALLIFGVVVFVTFGQFDGGVDLSARQIASLTSYQNGKITVDNSSGLFPGLALGKYALTPIPAGSVASTSTGDTNVNITTYLRIVGLDGTVYYSSPAFATLLLPNNELQTLKTDGWRGNVVDTHSNVVRLLSVSLVQDGQKFAFLQLGRSANQLTDTERLIQRSLLIAVPILLICSIGGSYLLAGRAFRPIHWLIQTARDIKGGDLHRRVPVPRANDDLRALALTFNEMIERLDQTFTQQRRFIADASHELRTPVAAIRSMTEIALVGEADIAAYAVVLRDVNAESERLGRLINELLLMARTDEGQIAIDRDPVQLDLLALDIITSMTPLAEERGIELVAGRLNPVTLLGDTARLIQVIMCLVDNALTYTNRGGRVTLTTALVDGEAWFGVSDTGIGIAPKDMPHLFERFYRADPARARASGGSGLGLSLAEGLVRAHGGSIVVQSAPGIGSTFTVRLPDVIMVAGAS